MQDLWAILIFLLKFAAWFLLVGLLAWGGGLVVRWLNRR